MLGALIVRTYHLITLSWGLNVCQLLSSNFVQYSTSYMLRKIKRRNWSQILTLKWSAVKVTQSLGMSSRGVRGGAFWNENNCAILTFSCSYATILQRTDFGKVEMSRINKWHGLSNAGMDERGHKPLLAFLDVLESLALRQIVIILSPPISTSSWNSSFTKVPAKEIRRMIIRWTVARNVEMTWMDASWSSPLGGGIL